MVRYYSDDGVFDAPVNKVWKLIDAHSDPNNKIHAALVGSKGGPQPDGSVKLEMTIRGPDGKTHTQQWRLLHNRPHSQTVEFVDGPFRGSWQTTAYIPEGNRTRCITVAEWKVQGVADSAATLKMANEFFDNGFEEDQRFLKTLK
jgi:hypothetical protein